MYQKVPRSTLAASYMQRWALFSDNLANVEVSLKSVEVEKRILGDDLPLHQLSYESWILYREFYFTRSKNRDSVFDGWPVSWIFHGRGAYHIKTRPLIKRVNQWTSFCTTGTFTMKELILCYLHVFIEIYSLIIRE